MKELDNKNESFQNNEPEIHEKINKRLKIIIIFLTILIILLVVGFYLFLNNFHMKEINKLQSEKENLILKYENLTEENNILSFNFISYKNETENKLNELNKELYCFKENDFFISALDFKIIIYINYFENGYQLFLASHDYYDFDRINKNNIKVIGHMNVYKNYTWELSQHGYLYKISLNDIKFGLKCNLKVENNRLICNTNNEEGSFFRFEREQNNEYFFKIKDNETEEYLILDLDHKRDETSYFINTSTDATLASEFRFVIFYDYKN